MISLVNEYTDGKDATRAAGFSSTPIASFARAHRAMAGSNFGTPQFRRGSFARPARERFAWPHAERTVAEIRFSIVMATIRAAPMQSSNSPEEIWWCARLCGLQSPRSDAHFAQWVSLDRRAP